jgi:hypothetical protein
MMKFGRAEGNLALQLEKKYYKTFWQSQNLVCTKPHVFLFILSF